MNEIWKDIKGFEGLYQVSNLGRVKSLRRWIDHVYNGGYWQEERIRALSPTRGGYLFLPLTKDKKTYPKRVNRLVAEAFLEDYTPESDIHHKDGNRTNNCVCNLECLSKDEHQKEHSSKKGIIARKGDETMLFFGLKEVEKYGFSHSNVSRCCKAAKLPDEHPRKVKYATHKGWKWRYAE